MQTNIVYLLEDCRGSYNMYPVHDLTAGIVLAHILTGDIGRAHDKIKWGTTPTQSKVVGYINAGYQPDFIVHCLPILKLNEYTSTYLNDISYFSSGARSFYDAPGNEWWTCLPLCYGISDKYESITMDKLITDAPEELAGEPLEWQPIEMRQPPMDPVDIAYNDDDQNYDDTPEEAE